MLPERRPAARDPRIDAAVLAALLRSHADAVVPAVVASACAAAVLAITLHGVVDGRALAAWAAMLALVLLSATPWRRGWLFDVQHRVGRWLLRGWQTMTLSGFVAILAGWYVTEIGRQPWLVYGTLTTAEAASSVPAPLIGISLTLYLLLYAGLLLAFVSVLFHLMHKAMGGHPPAEAHAEPMGAHR